MRNKEIFNYFTNSYFSFLIFHYFSFVLSVYLRDNSSLTITIGSCG
ncbi:MAG: hypothetical protein FWF29_02525 [Treponema sp.]|nr:hypothetical protein [Treponema sp.]